MQSIMSGFTKDSLQGFLHARRSQPTERRAADISRLSVGRTARRVFVYTGVLSSLIPVLSSHLAFSLQKPGWDSPN